MSFGIFNQVLQMHIYVYISTAANNVWQVITHKFCVGPRSTKIPDCAVYECMVSLFYSMYKNVHLLCDVLFKNNRSQKNTLCSGWWVGRQHSVFRVIEPKKIGAKTPKTTAETPRIGYPKLE